MIAGCALCGRPASRRIDLTYGEIGPRDLADFHVTSVLRGRLICRQCETTATIADLIGQAGGEIIVGRGCLVQCTGIAPRWLRWTLPNGVTPWSKAVCPSCHGRASVQLITEAAVPRRHIWREAWLQVFDLFRWRDDEEEDDGRLDSDSRSDPDPGAESAVPSGYVAVENEP